MDVGHGGFHSAGSNSRRMLPSVQTAVWEKATSEFLVPLQIRAGGDSIVGRIGARRVEDSSFCRLWATPHMGVRTAELAGGVGAGHYKVAMALRGRVVVRQHGRRVALRPGEITVYDTSDEYAVGGELPFGLLVALVPYGTFGLERERVARVAATALSGEGVQDAGRGLVALASGDDGDFRFERTMDAVRRLVREAPHARVEPRRRDAEELLARARLLIADKLADTGLSPGYVAAVLGVSRRYLYSLFSAEIGPVARYIRTQQLERARALLLDPREEDTSVTQIAAESGFTDPAHFSRLYRNAYGVSPAHDRRAAVESGPRHAVSG